MTDITDRLSAALADRYHIERELGAGGMATVYLAHDVKHDRKVALKVLRPELTAVLGGERFLNEIRLTANLQHPHILPLFDSGEADNLLFYVMPYIEGESLRARLEHEKELSIDEAVQIASQVSHALDYAHRHEVIHRDIKPENILLHDGQALVADFGIALAVRAAGGDRFTETGLSLGTPQYMSPEQAMADRELDARSDIYSLGSVTYEMLAGEPPYTGPNTQAIIAKIVTEDPRPLSKQRRSVPPHVEAAVHKTLEKLPADRFHTAAEFAEALARPGLFTPSGATAAAARPSAAAPKTAVRFLWPAAALLAGAAALWGWLSPAPPAATRVVARFIVTLPASEQLGEAGGGLITIAPDGSGFVYVGVGPNGRRLYFRPFNRFEARPIPGTEDAAVPFFSPDGRWVGFSADGKMQKVALAGGPLVPIIDGTYFGASWGPDDVILFSPADRDGLWTVSAEGGEPQKLTTPDSLAREQHFRPQFLPDGKSALFVSRVVGGASRIGVVSLRTRTVEYLVEGNRARYATSGHLIYATPNGLMAAPFDLGRLALTGPPLPVQADFGPGRGGRGFDLSRTGSLIYATGDDTERSLVTVDRQGFEQVLNQELRAYDGPRYSPDGRRVVLRIFEEDFHIWVYEIARGTFTRLTFESDNFYPEWTPNGRRIGFVSERNGGPDLFWRLADGSGSVEPLLTADLSQWEIAWAPDGKSFVYRQNHPETGRDLWVYRLDGQEQPRPLVKSYDQERAARVSPDGRYVAYVSDESEFAEVYVRTLAESGGKWQISTDGGTEPLWSRDGKELFYRHGDELIAVAVETEPVFTLGTSKVLFEGPYVPNPHHTNYDIHPDGDRFVMVKSAEGERQVVVVLNWVAELEGRGRGRGRGAN
ncbi:MAG: protein kinase [Gemmatimonadota bacterium]